MTIEKYNTGTESIDIQLGATAFEPYKITGAGVIPVNKSSVRIETDSADAFTLADGLVDGQRISITMVVDAGDATITTKIQGGTTITMDAVGDSITLEWIEELDKYVAVNNVGCVIA